MWFFSFCKFIWWFFLSFNCFLKFFRWIFNIFKNFGNFKSTKSYIRNYCPIWILRIFKNIDEFFFNLSENPNGFKNKDFRYTLSLIYQLIEDEFEGIFLSPNSPVRNTDFYLINRQGKLSFFVTPTNNFQYYLKSNTQLVSMLNL